MPIPGRFQRAIFGQDEIIRSLAAAGSATGFAMGPLNSGACFRFTAPDTRDIASVWINWSVITAPGTLDLRIETIDATTGKPTGSLYDANAVVTGFTPAAGWQQITFGTLPTTGLVAGNEYGVVLLTTVAGTTHSLRASITVGAYPTILLTAADGTTRSNFAEVVSGCPICIMVFEDFSEESMAMSPYATIANNNIFGNNATSLKIVVPTGTKILAAGIEIGCLTRIGTPAGDLRARIFDSNDVLVTGSMFIADKDSLTGVNTRRCRLHFAAVVQLVAGTYRIVVDSSASANSSNCWRINSGVARVASNVPSGFNESTTADLTATPIVWTDTPTNLPSLALILDNLTGGGVVKLAGDGGGLAA
jgi:hypothetical protein